MASEHLVFPSEGRAHGLRWKDQAARHKLLGQQNRGLYDLFISPFSFLAPHLQILAALAMIPEKEPDCD